MTHDEKRLKANRELVKILAEEIEKRPSERFGQILRNSGFVVENILQQDLQDGVMTLWANGFNQEPWETLARVAARLKDV